MAAMARERLVLRLLGDGARAPAWGADVDALVLLFVPFALAEQTMAGLAALGLYAAGILCDGPAPAGETGPHGKLIPPPFRHWHI